MSKRNHFRRLALKYLRERGLIDSDHGVKDRDLRRMVKEHAGKETPPRLQKTEGALLAALEDSAVKRAPRKPRTPRAPRVTRPISTGFYESDEWREVRYRALKLHGGCCQCCGARASAGKPLHVDHIKPRSKYPHLALDLSNLQVLCKDCNFGKCAWDETDWRGTPANDDQSCPFDIPQRSVS